VDLGDAGLAPWGGPLLVLNVGGRTVTPDGPAQLPTVGRLKPARSFHSSAVARSSMSQKFLQREQTRITVESQVEGLHASVLDRDEGIEAIVTQPFWISYQLGEVWHWACPDLLVAHKTLGWTVVECKSWRGLQSEKVIAKFDAMRNSLESWGLRFEVLTELGRAAQLNYDLLQTERRPPLHLPLYGEELLAACVDPQSLEELLAVGARACVAPVVWHLIWKGDLCITWEKPMTLETLVRCHVPESPSCQLAPKSCGTGLCGPLLSGAPPKPS